MDTLQQKIVAAVLIIILCASLPFREAEAAVSLVFWGEYAQMSTAQTTPHHSFATKRELRLEELAPDGKVQLKSELVPICACESAGSKYAIPRHFKKDGSVLRGEVVSDDIGLCQINRHFHGARAESMGLDLFSVEGNIQYANYLYGREGSKPWLASKSCWGSQVRQELTIK